MTAISFFERDKNGQLKCMATIREGYLGWLRGLKRLRRAVQATISDKKLTLGD